MPDPAGTEPVALQTADGIELVGWWQPTGGEPAGTVVLVHGFTATSGHPDVHRVAAALGAAGYGVLCYDSRGHGASGGLCTLGIDEVADVAAAVAWARRHPGPVTTLGASMGAIAVLGHAATDRQLAGAVVVSCPARWRLHSPQSALGALMTRTRPGRALLRRSGVRLSDRWPNPEPPETVAGRVRVPLAVVHGAADRFIPPDEGRRLSARAGGPSRLDLVAGMGHAYHPLGTGPIVAAVGWVATAGLPAAHQG